MASFGHVRCKDVNCSNSSAMSFIMTGYAVHPVWVAIHYWVNTIAKIVQHIMLSRPMYAATDCSVAAWRSMYLFVENLFASLEYQYNREYPIDLKYESLL